MKTGISLPFALVVLASVASAEKTVVITLNTTPLKTHPAGEFSLSFQLADGNGSENGDNIAILSGFEFGPGGKASGSPQLIGGAAGDLATKVVLTDREAVNFFAQPFTPGDQLRFTLTLTTNLDDGTIPDAFLFSILDKSGASIPTTAGGSMNSLVVVNLDSSDPTMETFGADPNRAPQGGGTAINGLSAQAATGNSVPGLRFVPLSPCRLVDTRAAYAGSRAGVFGPPVLAAGETRSIPMPSSSLCTVPSTAKAYVLNVTLDTLENQTGAVDQITIWPTGEPRPNFTTISTTTGGYIANAAIVKAGSGGAVNLYTSQAANLILDITGYFTEEQGSSALLYYPINPCRAVDTRGPVYSSLPPPYGNQRMQARENRSFRFPTSPGCSVPAAQAYSVQLTLAPGELTNGNPVAFITAYPTGLTQPNISNMNSPFGYAVANSAIVPASSNGSIDVFAYDATNLIIDINGYFAPDDGTGRGLYYFPVTQCRTMDTKSTTYSGSFGPPALSPSNDRTIPIAGSGCTGLPSTARAWALNAVAIPNGNGMPYLSMWPAGTSWPNISQLNAFQGQTVANSGIVPASTDGSIQIRVASQTHVQLDVAGYFGR